eukprot:scaffold36298_cov122-Isochrysis_galbana.AAC.4
MDLEPTLLARCGERAAAAQLAAVRAATQPCKRQSGIGRSPSPAKISKPVFSGRAGVSAASDITGRQ